MLGNVPQKEFSTYSLPEKQVFSQYTILLIKTKKELLLVDVGAGDFYKQADTAFPGLDHTTSRTNLVVPSLKVAGIEPEDIELLKVGRHFRIKRNKIIVGRNENENNKLIALKAKNDYYFEVPEIGSPITILKGPKTKTSIKIAAKLTAFYSDAKTKKIDVNFGREKIDKTTTINLPNLKEDNDLRI